MLQQFVFKGFTFVLTVSMLLFSSGSSYAWGGSDRHERSRSRGHFERYDDRPRFGMRINFVSRDYRPVTVYGARYYYYDGLYYAPAAGEYVLVEPPVGAVVPVIPPVYLPVVVNGITYYTDRGIYYVYTGRGYQVVPPPVMQAVVRPTVVTRTVRVASEPENQTKVAEGIGLGGILGALVGGIVGHQSHHGAGGALIGGAVGAATGGIIGAQIPNEDVSRRVSVTESVTAVDAQPLTQTITPMLPRAEEDSFTVNIPDQQGGYAPVMIRKSGNGFVGPQGEYYAEFPKVSQLQIMYGK